MYEDRYDLTDAERTEVAEVLSEIDLRGGRLTDAAGRPLPWKVLRGRRFLVCDKGRVWRYAPAGAPQVPGQRAGVMRRNAAIEMWTGRWRRLPAAGGKPAYGKCLVWVPVDEHINGHPGTSKINWYRSEKDFRHPLEGPEEPSEDQLAALERRREFAAGAVAARMRQEGLAPAEPAAAPQAAGTPADADGPAPTAPARAPSAVAARLARPRSGRDA